MVDLVANKNNTKSVSKTMYTTVLLGFSFQASAIQSSSCYW